MTATMKDCVEALAKRDGISNAEAKKRMESAVAVISEMCVEKGGVAFKGQFTITTSVRKGRSGNLNGHDYNSPDRKVLKIKANKDLDEALNG